MTTCQTCKYWNGNESSFAAECVKHNFIPQFDFTCKDHTSDKLMSEQYWELGKCFVAGLCAGLDSRHLTVFRDLLCDETKRNDDEV